jgi:maltose O-acetyltransferase
VLGGLAQRLKLREVARDTVLNGVVGTTLVPPPLRVALLRRLGFALGRGVSIRAGCFFGGRVAIGDGSFVNYGCFFDASAPISVGSGCRLGMGVTLATSTHELGPATARAGRVTASPISIGDGCWLGAKATVLPGVTIGNGVVVAAGAVVTDDCEPNGLYGGVPARLIKRLE